MRQLAQQPGQLLLSIVICTYNRCGLLAKCLESLHENRLAGAWEILVVDNHSSDQTVDVVEGFRRERDFSNLRYVYESEVGLSHARNRGWKEAVGEYVGYLDDDGKVNGNWLVVAREIIDQTSYQVFGGPYVPFYLSEVPSWWRDSYRSGGHGRKPVELTDWQFLSGGNFFIRKKLLADLGGFSPEHGMSGGKVGLGEETLLQIELRRKHPELPIYYDPRLFIEHLVIPPKMTLRWLVPFWFEEGRSECRLWQKHAAEKRLRHVFYRLFGNTLKAIGCGVWALIGRDRKKYPYWRNYLVEDWSQLIRDLGRDVEIWVALRSGRA